MADRYFVNGGVDSNWGSTSNWSTTSGGAGGAAVPTNADDVFFDANSPNCTVNTSARSCLALNFTGYTNTLTLTFGINCSSGGNLTLASGMTITGTGDIQVSGTTTLTSNGKAFPNALKSTGTTTITFADDWTVGGYSHSGTAAVTMNGSTLYCTGSFSTASMTTNPLAGTTVLRLTGTGTWTPPGNATGGHRLTTFIDTAGTITIASGIRSIVCALTYVTGTVINTGVNLTMTQGAAATLDVSGLSWETVTFGGSLTHTLVSDLNVTGTLNLGVTTTSTTINGSAINFSGSTITGNNITSGSVGGSTLLKVTNTCTISSSTETSGRCFLKLEINAPGEIITFGAAGEKWNHDISCISLIAGTVVAYNGNTWATGGSAGMRVHPGLTGGFRS